MYLPQNVLFIFIFILFIQLMYKCVMTVKLTKWQFVEIGLN